MNCDSSSFMFMLHFLTLTLESSTTCTYAPGFLFRLEYCFIQFGSFQFGISNEIGNWDCMARSCLLQCTYKQLLGVVLS